MTNLTPEPPAQNLAPHVTRWRLWVAYLRARLLHPWGHVYLSTGCLHDGLLLPDGRTGHQYCQSDTGKSGAKRPAECKFCGTPCLCPCHRPAA